MTRLALVALLLCAWIAATFAQSGSSSLVGATILGFYKGVNLNLTNSDNAVTVTATKYTIRRMTVTNCSVTPALARLGLFTATAGGGAVLVTPAVLTTLTAPSTLTDMTLAIPLTVRSLTTLYARTTVAQGSPLTCDVYLFGDVLP